MRYILTICLLLFVVSCESQPWVFKPCIQYGDGYLRAMSQYVCNLRIWDCNTQGTPPPPHQPSEMHTGIYPTPTLSRGTDFGSSFSSGLMSGYSTGMQIGAIKLQNARNEAYGVALNQYYYVVNSYKNSN